MMKRFFQALSMTIAGAAILGGSALQAAGHRSDPVEIPFDFKVQGKQLPSGTYRLQKGTTSGFASLVNVRTGKQVQLLRPLGNDTRKTKLVFEHQADGYVLKKLS
jgi:hypothetical protein